MIVGRMGRNGGFWASHKGYSSIGHPTAQSAVVFVRKMYGGWAYPRAEKYKYQWKWKKRFR